MDLSKIMYFLLGVGAVLFVLGRLDFGWILLCFVIYYCTAMVCNTIVAVNTEPEPEEPPRKIGFFTEEDSENTGNNIEK